MDTSIFKAYDIRGIYPDQLNEDIAYKIGNAYVNFIKPPGKVAVGMDVRKSSPQIKEAVISGITDAGANVVDIGEVSTEEFYFSVGNYGLGGGLMVTASHNPAEYNGFKMVRDEAKPISGDNGILEIRDLVVSGEVVKVEQKGTVEQKSVGRDFAKFALKFIDPQKIKPTKLVFNPNFGFEGRVLECVKEAGSLPLDLVPLNDQPNGNFPKGRPDPVLPENRPELIELVKSSNADLGVAWDADADRVFFCTDDGTFVEPYFLNAVLIGRILDKNPGSKIIYDPRYTWALVDAAKEHGGEAVLERVGHSFIKEAMRRENAIFSGESSGHTYFRDFWYADTGIIPLLVVLEMLSEEGKKLSEILAPLWQKYFISGEINFEAANHEEIFQALKNDYASGEINEIDGISVEFSNWRFNVRGSNTEPKLRLNLEAKSNELMQQKRDELVSKIKSLGKN